MKSTAWLLVLILIVPAEARERTPMEQAKKIPLGSEVVVSLKDKQVFSGRLGEVGQDGFTLQPFAAGEDRVVLFQDVKKITERKERSAAHQVRDDILLVLLLPVILVYCGFFNHECFG